MGKSREASSKDIQLAFFPDEEENLNPVWRMCKLEVLEPRESLPQFCSPQNPASYFATSDDKEIDDRGEVRATCARENFSARAIFELVSGGEYPSGASSRLVAAASFPNGTSWTASHDLNLYSQKYQQETEAFSAQRTITYCLGGWKPLPSGKSFCYVEYSRDKSSREEMCQLGGGYLLELLTREDLQTFVYLMHSIAKTSTSSVAIGAEVRSEGSTTKWVWQHSGKDVSLCTAGCLLQTSSESSVVPTFDQSLYLDLIRAPTEEDVYMSKHPYFALQARASSSSDPSYFVCMKDGENSAATATTLTVSTTEDELTPLAVTKISFTLKTAHHTQFPFKLEVLPSKYLRVCKLSVTHIGSNLPCLRNPAGQPKTSQNSSRLIYSSPKKKPGFSASIEFDMLANWGRLDSGWQKLRGGTGGPRQKVWTRAKILSPNVRYFAAN